MLNSRGVPSVRLPNSMKPSIGVSVAARVVGLQDVDGRVVEDHIVMVDLAISPGPRPREFPSR